MIENAEKKTTKQRGKGRLLLPEERRSFSVKPGFTEREMDILEARAESVGLTVAEFLRRLAISQPIYAIAQVNKAAVAELHRIGNNINQATRLMNTRLDDLEHNEFRSDLVCLRRQLDAVTRLLLEGPAQDHTEDQNGYQ